MLHLGEVWKTVLLVVAALAIVLLVSRNVRKAITVATGFGLYELFCQFYDNVLWPIIQGRYGPRGAVGMSVGAVVLNFTLLQVYQRKNIDWLGVSVFEAFKTRSEKFTQGLLAHPLWIGPFCHLPGRCCKFLMRGLKSRCFAFVALTTIGDSFLTTAFLREGRFGPLDRRDMVIFTASSILSCAIWVVWNAGVVGVFQSLWTILHFK